MQLAMQVKERDKEISPSLDNDFVGDCEDEKGQDHMSVCDMMEVDGVRGQAWVTFTGVLTAVPTGCCQATPHPH